MICNGFELFTFKVDLKLDKAFLESECFSFCCQIVLFCRFENSGPICDDSFDLDFGVLEILSPVTPDYPPSLVVLDFGVNSCN